MQKLLLAALACLFIVNVALAQAPATKRATAQQGKMKACNAQAKGKKGEARKAFMKQCLSARKTGAASTAARSETGKK